MGFGPARSLSLGVPRGPTRPRRLPVLARVGGHYPAGHSVAWASPALPRGLGAVRRASGHRGLGPSLNPTRVSSRRDSESGSKGRRLVGPLSGQPWGLRRTCSQAGTRNVYNKRGRAWAVNKNGSQLGSMAGSCMVPEEQGGAVSIGPPTACWASGRVHPRVIAATRRRPVRPAAGSGAREARLRPHVREEVNPSTVKVLTDAKGTRRVGGCVRSTRREGYCTWGQGCVGYSVVRSCGQQSWRAHASEWSLIEYASCTRHIVCATSCVRVRVRVRVVCACV